MCHGIACFETMDLVGVFDQAWPEDLDRLRDLPFIVRSLNEESPLIRDKKLDKIRTPQAFARFLVMDTKSEMTEKSIGSCYPLAIAAKLASIVRNVTGAAVGYMKDALFAEGIITPHDLHPGLPADSFPPTAVPMPAVKVDQTMVELEKRAEADAREVQKEVLLAEKKKRALAMAMSSVKV